jgi:VWFA-related protein
MTRAIPLLLCASALSAAQTGPAEPSDSGLVLRFDADLVQVDAVVTSRDGRRVAGLTADDFAVLQDGKPRKITHFSYQSDQAPRTLVIVVDDLSMDLDDFLATRKALARFLDEPLRPGDSTSLVSLSQGSGALRRLTSDPALPRRALERMFWRPPATVTNMLGDIPLVRELRQILVELRSVPGRKSLLVIGPATRRTQSLEVREIADLANRASTTIYGLDKRVLHGEPPRIGLLAEATGGLLLHDANAAFDQFLETVETAGYYLIGWQPGDDRGLDYHRVQIRTRDTKLQVRTREGFFTPLETAPQPRTLSTAEQMRRALTSPFHSGDLDVSLTASFVRQEAAGSFVDLLMHIGPAGVRFEMSNEGCWNVRLELTRALWPLDPGLAPSDRVATEPLEWNLCGDVADRVRRDGLVAAVRERVPSSGAYQVRVAVRNAADQAAKVPVGSATQFLALPDVRKGGLALSGVTVWSADAPATPGGDLTHRPARGSDPAIRKFNAGEELRYTFQVFGNAGELRVGVMRDGQENPAAPAPAGDGGTVSGALSLASLAPGRYVLHVSAVHSKNKTEHADQFVDFEVR